MKRVYFIYEGNFGDDERLVEVWDTEEGAVARMDEMDGDFFLMELEVNSSKSKENTDD